MMKKILQAGLLLLTTTTSIWAWTQDGEYGTPGDYLYEMGPDARELGRGGGSAALTENSGAIYLNPGGLGSIERADILATYVRIGDGFNYYFGSFAYPFGKFGTVGIGITGIGVGDIPNYDEFGIQNGSYGAFDNTFAIAYGIRFIDRINLGLNIKIATQSIAEESGAGVGLDWGATIKAFEWLHFGLGMSHLGGPQITLISEEESYASTARLGLGFKLLDSRLQIHADGMIVDFISDDKDFKDDIYRAMRWNAGVEYKIIEYLEARVGINDRQFTFGASFNVADFSVGYAGLVHLEEKDFRSPLSHVVSVNYSFGKPIPEKEKELDKKLKEVDEISKLNEVQNLFVMGYYQKAFDAATELRNKNPENEKINSLYERIRAKLSEEKSGELIKNIENKLAAKKYNEAKLLLSELLEIAPEDSVAVALNQKMIALGTVNEKLTLVKTLYAQEKYDEVDKEVDFILSVDSTNTIALEYNEKISDYVNKRNADNYYRRAYELYHESKDVEGASAELKKALSLIPDHKEAGTLYEKISAEMKAIYLKKVGQMASNDKLNVDNEALQKLMEIDAEDQIQQARKELDEGLIAQALATINSVLKKDPQNVSALDLQKQIEVAENNSKAENLYNEALREFNNGNIDKSESIASQAINLAPNHEKLEELLTELKKKKSAKNIGIATELLKSEDKEKIEEARDLIDDFLLSDPDHKEAAQLKKDIAIELIIIEANSYIDNDQYEQADRTIQKALSIDPDNEKAKAAFKNIKDVINLFVE